jgi:hypothetical protein
MKTINHKDALQTQTMDTKTMTNNKFNLSIEEMKADLYQENVKLTMEMMMKKQLMSTLLILIQCLMKM